MVGDRPRLAVNPLLLLILDLVVIRISLLPIFLPISSAKHDRLTRRINLIERCLLLGRMTVARARKAKVQVDETSARMRW